HNNACARSSLSSPLPDSAAAAACSRSTSATGSGGGAASPTALAWAPSPGSAAPGTTPCCASSSRITDSGCNPMKPSIGRPPLSSMTVGSDWMPNMPASCISSSALTLASTNAPAYSSASFSSSGPNCRHGPHHGAQKSTSTGACIERSSTSCAKVAAVASIVVGMGGGVAALGLRMCMGGAGNGDWGRGTGSREQGTGNREQGEGTGNREQGTGNREQGTGNREQGTPGSCSLGADEAPPPVAGAFSLPPVVELWLSLQPFPCSLFPRRSLFARQP